MNQSIEGLQRDRMRCNATTQWVALWNICHSTIYYGRSWLSGIDAAGHWQRWMVMGPSDDGWALVATDGCKGLDDGTISADSIQSNRE
eukprot:scaffold83808_cov114-Attheya_sp.AAC.3